PGDAVDGVQSGKTAGKTDGKPKTDRESQATQPTPDRNQPTSMPPAPLARAADESGGPEPRRPAALKVESAPSRTPGRVKASPLARRMAAERGLDLGGVSGTGPEGRIVARDLEAVTPATAGASPAVPQPNRNEAFRSASTPFTDVPLSQIRKTIARR